jgi:hypothetical protein
MPVDQASNRLVAQPFGRGIDRKYLASERLISVRVLIGEDDELAGGEADGRGRSGLAPTSSPRSCPYFNGAVEECLTGPGIRRRPLSSLRGQRADPEPRAVGSSRLTRSLPMQATIARNAAFPAVMVDASRYLEGDVQSRSPAVDPSLANASARRCRYPSGT